MCNEKEIAYCGLYCGNCIIRKGSISQLSKQLIEIMKTDEFKKLVNGLPEVFPEISSDIKKYQN